MTIQNRSRIRLLLSLVAILSVIAGVSLLSMSRNKESAPLESFSIDLEDTPAQLKEVLLREISEAEKDPSSSLLWGHLGMRLMAHHYHHDAMTCFQKAAQLDEQEFRWTYYQAVLLEESNLRASVGTYSKAVQQEPQYSALRLRYANVLMHLARPTEAIQQLHQAVELAPQEHNAYLRLGYAAIQANEIEQARDHFQQAVAKANWCRRAHEELARTYLLLNDLKASYHEQQLALRLRDIQTPPADPILGEVKQLELVFSRLESQADQLAMQGDLKSAADAYREIIRNRPELIRPRMNLGQALFQQGRADEGIQVYRELLDQFPEDASAYRSLGMMLEAVKDENGAIDCYQRSIQIKSDYVEAHLALGFLLEKQNRLAEAATAYRSAVDAGPQFASAHFALGMFLNEMKEIDAAIESVEKAVRLAPGDPTPKKYLEHLLKEPRP